MHTVWAPFGKSRGSLREINQIMGRPGRLDTLVAETTLLELPAGPACRLYEEVEYEPFPDVFVQLTCVVSYFTAQGGSRSVLRLTSRWGSDTPVTGLAEAIDQFAAGLTLRPRTLEHFYGWGVPATGSGVESGG
ncbi:hypothetical protein [Streptomyces triticirhizae]|uniref:Uncharacterized protein n=1 Tax=Streptomyces triticirhizae TaxID=2483353 RepID=A0A3M2M813_9ACTN|nr:hypothetical protein [Streptomyces triticirhizae]RMI44983.1 hypothetical protein EBN88_04095 [Streptomyces triticirhizae]